jgi:hypothetical protein
VFWCCCHYRSCRRDYIKLWSEQRRYLVSELLPESGAVEPKPAAAAGKGDKGKGKPAAPLVPQGAMKAQAIIAAALAEADAAVAAKRLAEPQPAVQEEPSEPEEEEEEAAEVPAAPAGEEVGFQLPYAGCVQHVTMKAVCCVVHKGLRAKEEEAAEVPAAPAGETVDGCI